MKSKSMASAAIACWLLCGGVQAAESPLFDIDVWADNWFAAHLDGESLFEDSVSIKTERSFNAESHTFSASLPFVLAFEIKDFKENDTGLEYIGSNRQQMGDGGFIAQIRASESGDTVAISNANMRCLVVHKAPLNSQCVQQSQPVAGQGHCQFTKTDTPDDWANPSFDDSQWPNATEFASAQVRPKDGYDRIQWDSGAKLVWTGDLEKDNTLLCRLHVGGAMQSAEVHVEPSSSDIHAHFEHFHSVETWEDETYLHVESNGLPAHGMMVGISSWQQQVPLPQNYRGDNSWKIPLNPVLAENPMLSKDHFHKGAIAIAVNGVPIFNALNNRGEYSADVGELDQWGGHSGRADDYHYHLAPEHLEEIVGVGEPIAYALDGFPLYSQTTEELDQFLGRSTQSGGYQYHAVDNPPYLIAALRGEVEVDSLANAPEDQIVPQAKSEPVRHNDYGPLNGAEITGFKKMAEGSFSLEYELNNATHRIDYSWDDSANYRFIFVDNDGEQVLEEYSKNARPASAPREQIPARSKGPKPENQQPRKFCGDGICDGTESKQQCAADCGG